MQGIILDEKQLLLQQRLEVLGRELYQYIASKRSFLSKVRGRKLAAPPGLYIYGEVGRGKTMIVSHFFNQLQIESKCKYHFHDFMLQIHQMLNEQRKQSNNKSKSDYLKTVAKQIAARYNLLYLDELQIKDITDAMIVGRLFENLINDGVVIILTSNRIPNDLYKNGIQRERFEPFIDTINKKMAVINLQAKQDYRLSKIFANKCLYYPQLGPDSERFIQESFAQLLGNHQPTSVVIESQGRKLHFASSYNDILFTNFDELCRKPLGPADYIKIAQNFKIVILSSIPKLTKEERNEATRFIALIDELYKNHVILICSAAARPQELYVEGDGSFEFARTVSRLIEMQSEEYACYL
jgi:cell division protein ZapE